MCKMHALTLASTDNMNGTVVITPQEDAATYINGKPLLQTYTLHHGDRIVFGRNFVFRYANPIELNKL